MNNCRCCFEIELLEDILDLDVELELGTVIYEGEGTPYEGPYEVIPKAYDTQILEAKAKTMRKDVTIHKVPYQAVSNPSGGLTVTIAFEEQEG